MLDVEVPPDIPHIQVNVQDSVLLFQSWACFLQELPFHRIFPDG